MSHQHYQYPTGFTEYGRPCSSLCYNCSAPPRSSSSYPLSKTPHPSLASSTIRLLSPHIPSESLSARISIEFELLPQIPPTHEDSPEPKKFPPYPEGNLNSWPLPNNDHTQHHLNLPKGASGDACSGQKFIRPQFWGTRPSTSTGVGQLPSAPFVGKCGWPAIEEQYNRFQWYEIPVSSKSESLTNSSLLKSCSTEENHHLLSPFLHRPNAYSSKKRPLKPPGPSAPPLTPRHAYNTTTPSLSFQERTPQKTTFSFGPSKPQPGGLKSILKKQTLPERSTPVVGSPLFINPSSPPVKNSRIPKLRSILTRPKTSSGVGMREMERPPTRGKTFERLPRRDGSESREVGKEGKEGVENLGKRFWGWK